jgi:hypothetical protein
MPHYHGSAHDFPVGHIIKSGGHGDRHRRFMMPQLTHIFESACEDIRANYFKALKPSRFDCIFACLSAADLDVFCKKFGSRNHYYEVEAIDPKAPLHRGTWHLTHGSELHGMVNCAWAYWTQTHQDCIEIVLGGDVRVLQKLK